MKLYRRAAAVFVFVSLLETFRIFSFQPSVLLLVQTVTQQSGLLISILILFVTTILLFGVMG